MNVSDEKLTVLAQSGDEEATEFLLNKYKALVSARVKRYYLAGATKEDLVQEGMIGLYRAIMSFNLQKNQSFSSFASVCIKRRLVSAIRSANRQKHQPLNSYVSLSKPVEEDEEGRTLEETLENASADPEEIFLKEERSATERQRIDDALSNFEKRVVLWYLHGLTYADIAKKLQTSEKSVDNAMQRVKQKLRRVKF